MPEGNFIITPSLQAERVGVRSQPNCLRAGEGPTRNPERHLGGFVLENESHVQTEADSI